MAALAKGALLGARGNSGVILAAMLRGLADTFAEDNESAPAGTRTAAALSCAAEAAYGAVAEPVEGTMLTVGRAAAETAGTAGDDLSAVVTAAAAGAREALARTPDQLEVLRLAGVVDAGGRGLCVLLDALQDVVTGTPPEGHETGGPADATDGEAGNDATPTESPDAGEGSPAHAGDPGGPAYEVMYLLDAPGSAIAMLREALAPLGDSLVVVGGEPTWNVHVHVDDVGAAIEAGIAAGHPHRIRVTSFREQALASGAAAPDGRGVVSVVAGEGLGDLFEAAGATVVRGGPGRRASMGELLDGLRRAGARDLVVLPNDRDSLAVAEAAAGQARDEGLRVAVIPTTASVQALAALAVHDESRRFEDDVVHMTAAASHCRHGGVTVAARASVTMAGVCREGDVLGIVEGDFVLIGEDVAEMACAVIERMLGSGGELVTLVIGADAAPGLGDAVTDRLRRTRPEVDTVVYEGGQPRYPVLIGVE